jgi:hypothetical protein
MPEQGDNVTVIFDDQGKRFFGHGSLSHSQDGQALRGLQTQTAIYFYFITFSQVHVFFPAVQPGKLHPGSMDCQPPEITYLLFRTVFFRVKSRRTTTLWA